MRFIVDIDIDIEVEPRTPREVQFTRELREHIGSSLVEDFGRGAWGGYEGPFVESVTVRQEESNGL